MLLWLWGPGGLNRLSFTQWAPTLTVHDPNPPITLETPEEEPPAGGISTRLLLMGVGG